MFVNSTDQFGRSRKIAILLADGFDTTGYEGIKAGLESGSAICETIGPRKSGVKSASGKVVKPDYHFEGNRSTMYDAIAIPGGAEHVKVLAANGRAIHWIREAFGHCKAIGAFGEGECFNLYLAWD
jgi:catalase